MDPTILVVDDDPDLRTLLRRVLERAGYQVRCAPDGLAALGEIEAAVPDLILSDIRMPRLDGMARAERVARLAVPIPMILMRAD